MCLELRRKEMYGNKVVNHRKNRGYWTLLSGITNFSQSPFLNNEGGSICRADEFLCNNSLCKLHFWVCDGEDDCGDNSDEAPDMCGMVSHVAHIELSFCNITLWSAWRKYWADLQMLYPWDQVDKVYHQIHILVR